MEVMEEGGVKHLLKSLVHGQFVKYWPTVITRTSSYRSEAEKIVWAEIQSSYPN